MHYELRLFDFFNEHVRKETSVDELAQIWHCSTRYAKTIVKKMQQLNIIKWEVTKGRGKKPFITLLQSKEECIIRLFISYWEKNQFEEAYSLIGKYQMLQNSIIQNWLQQQYGIQQNEQLQHILRLPFFNQNLTVNPLQALSNWDAHLIKQIHEPLFKENEATGEIEANLLFDYETTDYKKWRLILRKDAYFHHLKPVCAEDIQFSLERLAQLAKPYFDYEQFEIVHALELTLTLSKPFALLPELLSSFRTVILPKDTPDGTIGCGPFMLEKSSPYLVKLTTFNRYFNKRPYLDGIEFIFDNNDTEFGISYSPYAHDIPQKELLMQQFGTDYVVLNMQNGPLQNDKMRETVYALIQPEDFIKNTMTETISTNWLPIHKQHLSATIHCIGNDFPTLSIGYQYLSSDVNYLDKALILQSKLNQFGIKTELERIDLYKDKSVDSSIDIFIGGATFGKQSILSILNIYFTQPKAILSFLDEYQRNRLIQSLEKIYTTKLQSLDEATLNELVEQTQKIYCLKMLTHRQQRMYVREDFIYKNVKFDSNGFIQYNKIYFNGK